MTRLLLISGLICLSGFIANANAQVYTFYFDTTPGSDAYAGHEMAEIEITIAGNELTAIIRNTSPDAENGGGGLPSPAIIGLGLELQLASGGLGKVLSLNGGWTLDGFEGTAASTRGTISEWNQVSQVGNLFSFEPDDATEGLYNPKTPEGRASDSSVYNFTGNSDGNRGAELTAYFSGPIQLVEPTSGTFSPIVRFGYVGSAQEEVVTLGIPIDGFRVVLDHIGHSPEPGSLLIWALGIATWVGVHRRRRRLQPVRKVGP
jgi:hypothetical protein